MVNCYIQGRGVSLTLLSAISALPGRYRNQPKRRQVSRRILEHLGGKGGNKQRDHMTSSLSSASQVLAGIRTARGREPRGANAGRPGWGCEVVGFASHPGSVVQILRDPTRRVPVQNAGIPQHQEI